MTNLLLEDNKQYFLDAVCYFNTFFQSTMVPTLVKNS